MPRIALDLNKDEDRQKVKGQWRLGPGAMSTTSTSYAFWNMHVTE